MKILVTGGRGFIGSHVCPMLEEEHEVVATDINDLDIRDYGRVLSQLRNEAPDLILHLAAKAGGPSGGGSAESKEDPRGYLRTNILGTLNIYEACRVAGVDRVTLMSSFSTYGPTYEPIDESTPQAPESPYGLSKLCTERIADMYSDLYGVSTVVFRAPLVVGEGQVEFNAIHEFVDSALEGQDLIIYGEGTHKREWLHPEDVGRAFLKAVERFDEIAPDSIILGAPQNLVSMIDLAEMVREKVGSGRIKHKDVDIETWDQWTDIGKAKSSLDWEPRVSLDEIIERVVEDRAD